MKKTLLFSMLILLSYSAMVAQSYDVKINSSNTVASIVMPTVDYNSWITNDEFGNSPAKRAALVKNVYKKFNDEFDIIFLVLNETSVPTNFTYAGMNAPVSNNTLGIGKSIYSSAADYGSKGKLKSVIFLPKNSYILSGPTLHEIMHNWANFGIKTGAWNYTSATTGTPNTNYGSHWGVTGGSSNGQLGGFTQDSLYTNIDGNPNKYKVNNFGLNANGGNGVPYTEFELYLMGMIPASDVKPFDAFNDLTSFTKTTTLNSKTGQNVYNYVFEASTRTTYNATKLVSDLGTRNPSNITSQKDFRVLFVVLSNASLSQTEWTSYDTQVNQFCKKGDDGSSWLYNFWEATGGRGTLKADMLDKVQINKTAIALTSQNSKTTLFKNASCPITWTNTISGNVKIELYQNGENKQTIASSVAASSGTFTWNIPNNITMGDNYWIKLSSLNDQTIYAYNDSSFSIGMKQYTISGNVTDKNGTAISNATVSIGSPLVLDQSVETLNQWFPLNSSNAVWQSFTPSNNTIGKVAFYLAKNGTPGDVTVTIKDKNGISLWSTIVLQDSISASGSGSWVNVNILPAISVDPNQEYFLYLTNSFEDANNYYYWKENNASTYTKGKGNVYYGFPNLDFGFKEWSGDGATTTTTSNGFYYFNVTDGWSGTIKASATNFDLYPDSLVFTNINSNKSNQNFVEYVPSLSVSSNTATIAQNAGSTTTVKITSNTEWTAISDGNWLTINPSTTTTGNATITLTASANTNTTTRSATVTVSGTGVSSQTITVTQAEGSETGISIEYLQKKCYSIIGNTVSIENNGTLVYSILGQCLSVIGDKAVTLPVGIYIIQTPYGSNKIVIMKQ